MGLAQSTRKKHIKNENGTWKQEKNWEIQKQINKMLSRSYFLFYIFAEIYLT